MSSRTKWLAAGLTLLALGPATAQRDPLPPVSVTRVPTATAASAPAPPAARAEPLLVAASQQVAAAPNGFEAYKSFLAARARREGVQETTIALIAGLSLDERVMRLDRAQPGGPPNSNYIPPFAPYRRDHVTPSLIGRGQGRYADLYPALRQLEARYGVDPAVTMAIFGHETSYGRITGSFDMLESLASLAYEGRRRELFEGEFIAALKLIDIGIPRWRLKGSYAGATGFPQFMPSVVLRLRADGDGDGYADLWRSELDGLASIANYLRNAGWKANVPWGVAVRTPATLNRQAIANDLRPPRCPRVYDRHSRWLTAAEWRALGVVPMGRALPDNEMATLLEPDGPNETAYLLTSNYRAILDYNCSNFYALSVGLLADAIARR